MKRRDMLVAASALMAASIAHAQSPAPTAPDQRFVLVYAPGPRWEHAKGFRDQPGIDAHVTYMRGFLARGQLAEGGPFLDDTGGIMILDVRSLQDARRIAAGDPTVRAGLLRVSVHPWLRAFVRK